MFSLHRNKVLSVFSPLSSTARGMKHRTRNRSATQRVQLSINIGSVQFPHFPHLAHLQLYSQIITSHFPIPINFCLWLLITLCTLREEHHIGFVCDWLMESMSRRFIHVAARIRIYGRLKTEYHVIVPNHVAFSYLLSCHWRLGLSLPHGSYGSGCYPCRCEFFWT